MSNRGLQRQRIMSTFPSGTGGPKAASPSHSLPDLRVSSNLQKMLGMSPATRHENKTQVGPTAGASKSMTAIQYPRRDQFRTRFTVPNFGHSKEDAPKLPNHQDMILGVLRAGDAHCQRGMKWGDILEVVYYVYPNLPKSQASTDSLKRTLENVVAKGVVSRSFGARPLDATYRLVNYAATPTSVSEPGFGLNLAVSGTAIQPVTGSTHRIGHGLGLPSGNNFQTRVARTPGKPATTVKPKPKTAIPKIPTFVKPKSATQDATKAFASFSSVEKCKLSKSFAYRVGAIEMLKPLECIPNSPVSRQDRNPDWNEFNQDSLAAGNNQNRWELQQSLEPVWEDEDREEERDDNRALTDRFRSYAQAINLESEDDGEDDDNVEEQHPSPQFHRVGGISSRISIGLGENLKDDLARKMSASLARFQEIEVN